jgi:sugar phosphate isomerase/epimerase
MKLSLTAWSFPLCTLKEVAAISTALGIQGIDVGYRYKSSIDRTRVLKEPEAYGAALRSDLAPAIANVWHLFGADRTVRHLAGEIDPRNRDDLARVLAFCRAVGAPSLFLLPGHLEPGQSRRGALARVVTALGPMVEMAAQAGVALTVEPHVHAWLESPAMTLDLLRELPGLRLTLDPAHFACMGYRQDEIEALCPYVGHVHLRQARPGVLQCKLDEGTLNFPAFFAALRDTGYEGWLAIEYLNQPYMATVNDDVLLETIRMRDVFLAWTGTG